MNVDTAIDRDTDPGNVGTGLPSHALWFLGAVVALLVFGIVLLFSASFYRGADMTGDPTFYLRRQLWGTMLGGIALLIGVSFPPRLWLRAAPYLFSGVAVLLFLVLLIGVDRNGARRWFSLPLVGSLQPSELAKITVPLFIAWCYQRWGLLDKAKPVFLERRAMAMLAAVGVVAALVILEPDYGTGAFLLAVGGALFLVGGLPRRTISLAAVVVAVAAVPMFLLRKEVILSRFSGMFDPRSVYQVDQSLMGIQGGGVTGTGLGLGLQKAMVPEAFTDFIVAVLGEEFGFVGFLILVGLLSLLLHTGARIVLRCKDPALRLVALGFLGGIVLQACINLAVTTAAAPTKGIPMPLVSYGSSGLSVTLLAVGLLLGIARYEHRRECERLREASLADSSAADTSAGNTSAVNTSAADSLTADPLPAGAAR
ncbi:MAG: FtsW/RodA/SpoVE family cell cycle protein [Planctomycetota bacterium]